MSAYPPTLLPDQVKYDLCRELLDEFGAKKVTVRREAHELTHCCVMPWHNENNPSASINWKKLVFACLGCQSSGGLLWLISVCRDGMQGAREWVENKTGVGHDTDSDDLLRMIEAMYAETSHRAEPIPRYSPRALDPWRKLHPWLTLPTDAPVPGRGIPRQNAVDLQLGYAERFPVQDGHSERIVIPHFWRGALVGWQTRRLSNDGTPKYLSSEGFPRDRTLYDHDPRRRLAVVVESPMSVARHRHHLPTVATFGAKVTAAQLRQLADYETIVVWPDPDPDGWKWVEGWEEPSGHHPGLVEQLEPYSEVLVVPSLWNVDPGGLDDDDLARDLVLSAVTRAEWERPAVLRCWDCKDVHEGRCVAT